MQEGNWGDIEKVFQKTHVYLWLMYHNIANICLTSELFNFGLHG